MKKKIYKIAPSCCIDYRSTTSSHAIFKSSVDLLILSSIVSILEFRYRKILLCNAWISAPLTGVSELTFGRQHKVGKGVQPPLLLWTPTSPAKELKYQTSRWINKRESRISQRYSFKKSPFYLFIHCLIFSRPTLFYLWTLFVWLGASVTTCVTGNVACNVA